MATSRGFGCQLHAALARKSRISLADGIGGVDQCTTYIKNDGANANHKIRLPGKGGAANFFKSFVEAVFFPDSLPPGKHFPHEKK